jgi:hypothetical protein
MQLLHILKPLRTATFSTCYIRGMMLWSPQMTVGESLWHGSSSVNSPGIGDSPIHRWKGPFKIWCDDLRPANVLLNENMQIVGVVDWEFTYAAPAEFSSRCLGGCLLRSLSPGQRASTTGQEYLIIV